MLCTAHEPGLFSAHAYPVFWRIVAAVLYSMSRASLTAILFLVLLANDPPVTPPILLVLVVIFALLPGLAAWLIRQAFATEVHVRGTEIVLRRRDLRIEVPFSAIARVDPWALPLPGPGFSLRMRSGRRFGYTVQSGQVSEIVAALAKVVELEGAAAAADHPTLVYAAAKASGAKRSWYHVMGKFPLFALLPTLPLFRVHQIIAYGGPLGEYYLLGLKSYLTTFAVYWITLTIYLVLYASIWRGVAEGSALLAAWIAPARAATVRRVLEVWCRLVYYGGVPVLLGLRFLP